MTMNKDIDTESDVSRLYLKKKKSRQDLVRCEGCLTLEKIVWLGMSMKII